MYSNVILVDGSGEIVEARRVQTSRPLNADAVRMGAVASGIVAVSRFLGEASLQHAVAQALDALAPATDLAIRAWAAVNETGMCYQDSRVGALIHILLTRPVHWPEPRPVSFQTLFVAKCDLNATDALNKYLAVPSIFQGAPEGTEQLWRFVWKTL